jgi:hypothetical protein
MKNEILSKEELQKYHDFCICNKPSLAKSDSCGCFYCLEIYHPNTISEWVNEAKHECKTAICPNCGIDSVIANSDVEIDKNFLVQMKKFWF